MAIEQKGQSREELIQFHAAQYQAEHPNCSPEFCLIRATDLVDRRLAAGGAVLGDGEGLLGHDWPFQVCSMCGRKTFDANEFDQPCGFQQPDKSRCLGTFYPSPPIPAPAPDNLEEILARKREDPEPEATPAAAPETGTWLRDTEHLVRTQYSGQERRVRRSLRPFADRVLVEPIPDNEFYGGMAIPAEVRERSQFSRVIAFGPGKLLANGLRVEIGVKPGQIVAHGRHAGALMELNGEERYILRSEEIIGVVEEEELPKEQPLEIKRGDYGHTDIVDGQPVDIPPDPSSFVGS